MDLWKEEDQGEKEEEEKENLEEDDEQPRGHWVRLGVLICVRVRAGYP